MQNSNFDDVRNTAEETVFGKNSNQYSKKENGITMVLCFIAAICIWFYVMSIDSPTATEIFSSVSVTVVNDRDLSVEMPLAPISGTGNVIEVKLKGRKTLLNDLRESDIEAYVDVSEVMTTGKGVYTVMVEAPEGTVIEDYYPKEITVYMDKRSSVTVPVQAHLEQYSLVSGYTVNLSSPTLSLESIQVSGPESELAKIDHARLTVSFPGTITRSFSSAGLLTLVDESGNEINTKYLTMSETEATARYHVYTTKTIDLAVAYKYGYFAENGTEVSIQPKSVKVKGTVEVLELLESHTVATIDETMIAEDGDHAYPLKLPEGVEFADANQSDTVSIKIRFTKAKLNKVRITTSNAEIINVPEGKKVEVLDEAMTVNVRGTTGALMFMTAKDFSLIVDAAHASTNGDQYITASVAVKDGNSADLYVVGDYSLQIRVSDAEE